MYRAGQDGSPVIKYRAVIVSIRKTIVLSRCLAPLVPIGFFYEYVWHRRRSKISHFVDERISRENDSYVTGHDDGGAACQLPVTGRPRIRTQ